MVSVVSKWFGKKQPVARKRYVPEGASVMYQSLVQTPGKPVWTAREYQRFADEAYGKNVIAHRAISLVAQGAAGVPWLLYNNKEEVRNHPILKLLSRPSPNLNGAQFIENLITYRMISGNAYVLAIGAEGGAPLELHLLRPDRVQVIAGKNGHAMGYQYQTDKKVQQYMMHPVTGHCAVLHLKTFHPLNDWYGLSPIEAAAYSIDQHNEAGQWNQSLMQNGARPSGALVVKGAEGSLSEEQYRRLKTQMDEQYSGAMNAGRPLLLEGGLDWKEMSLSPKDMDFINAKHSAARDIALAFGVPPQLLGIPGDNTYSNLAEARLALWEQTILPLLENITGSLNNWLVPQFGKDLKLDYDTDEISALNPRREVIWNRLKESNFMTLNEKRRTVGLSAVANGDEVTQ